MAKVFKPSGLTDVSDWQKVMDAVEVALTAQPVAQERRSFPDAADGRPMPPMGDDLMTAGLNGEDARFVAIQLAQNGLTLVPAAPVSAGKVKAIAEAFEAGALSVHREWVRAHADGEGPPRGDPEFSEAAADYAALQPGDGWQGIESAATELLNDKAAFARMVDAAEEIHETGVSFNVVIGDALRAASLPQGEETR